MQILKKSNLNFEIFRFETEKVRPIFLDDPFKNKCVSLLVIFHQIHLRVCVCAS